MSLPTARYRPAFEALAGLASLPPWTHPDYGIVPPGVYLEAQCLQESSGDPKARHYDEKRDTGGFDSGDHEEWASFGLFQIEGSTARGLLPGLTDFSVLYLPGLNIACAVRLLADNVSAYGSVDRALAAYNGGAWGAKYDPHYKLNNQTYVDAVARRLPLVIADRNATRAEVPA